MLVFRLIVCIMIPNILFLFCFRNDTDFQASKELAIRVLVRKRNA